MITCTSLFNVDGSRGAAITVQSGNEKQQVGTLLKYFSVQNAHHHSTNHSSSVSSSSAVPAANTATAGSVPTDTSESDCILIGVSQSVSGSTAIPAKQRVSNVTKSSSSAIFGSVNGSSSLSTLGAGTVGAGSSSSSSSSVTERMSSMAATAQLNASLLQDLRKQADGLRTAKDQAESKVISTS